MKLTKIYENLILEATLPQIKEKYVGDGKVIVKVAGRGKQEFDKLSEEVWDSITKLEMTLGNKQISLKPNYLEWLTKYAVTGDILEEDLYKYGDHSDGLGYISMFVKAKNKLEKKDINQYKDPQEFTTNVIREYEALQKYEDEGGDRYVKEEHIRELKSVGIQYLGKVAGYQCFKVPEGSYDEEAYKIYKKHLQKCHGRTISICTMGSFRYFTDYTSGSKKGDMYVFFNQDDKEAPYQFHYEQGEFRDRNDAMVI